MRVREMVDLATSQPPPQRYSIDEIVQAGQRVQRRRRLGWATASAAVAVGVLVAVAVPSIIGRATAPTTTGEPSPAAVGPVDFPVPQNPFTYTFGAYKVGKLSVAKPIDVSTAYQLASVYADGLTTNDRAVDPNEPPSTKHQPTLYAYLTVYRPGAYDAAKLQGEPVKIGDRDGIARAREQHSSDGPWAARRTLAWQYSPNAWAVIESMSSEADYPSAKDLRQLAGGLRPSAPAEAKVPFTMNYVPAGYHLDEVSMHGMRGLNGIASARNGDYAGLLFSNPAQPTTMLTEPYGGLDGVDPAGSFQVFVVPAASSNQTPTSGIKCFSSFCNRWSPDGRVNIQVSSGGRLSTSEMTRILNGITLGNVGDDGSWVPVSAAIP